MRFSSMIKNSVPSWNLGDRHSSETGNSISGRLCGVKESLSQLWVPIWITIPKVYKASSEFVNVLAKETAQHATHRFAIANVTTV